MGVSDQVLLNKALGLLRRIHEWGRIGSDADSVFQAYEECYGRSDFDIWQSVEEELERPLDQLRMAHFVGVCEARRVVVEQVETLLMENGLGHLIGKEPMRPVVVVDNTRRGSSASDEGKRSGAGLGFRREALCSTGD